MLKNLNQKFNNWFDHKVVKSISKKHRKPHLYFLLGIWFVLILQIILEILLNIFL